MSSKNPRIVFMGTPELAAFILDELLKASLNIVTVVTAPDKPAGRGRKLRQSPVKLIAAEKNIPLLQPENLKDPAFLSKLTEIRPDIQIVVAFRMLPEAVWSIPSIGTFNMHASLLPDYRGAAPINWTIINGEKITGVTTFLIDHKIDTGNILLRKEISIDPYETAGSLHEKMKHEGAAIVLNTTKALCNQTVRPIPQSELIKPEEKLNLAPKIHKEDCQINWNQPVAKIINFIHGLSPIPGAYCKCELADGQVTNIKIFEARPVPAKHEHPTGHLITNNKDELLFAAKNGFVQVLQLQLPGKKRMRVDDLLRGYQFS